MEEKNIQKLKERAKELRKSVLDLTLETGEGHLGGNFSEIEILISLYDETITDNDKFILSKGHACYPLYILLREKGNNPTISEHPSIDEENGICCTTGSLGHGLPIGVGMALARKLSKKDGKIYVLMGDSELQEGTTWEASLIASHYRLDNLVVIVDYNKLQALGAIDDILSLGDLTKKFKEFGFNVSRIDGHSFPEIINSLKEKIKEKPRMIIADTIKGKGVSFMENDPKWHARKASADDIKKARRELD
jgi:transketolase